MKLSRTPKASGAGLLILTSFAWMWLIAAGGAAQASTYVVYVALDSPIYQELDTLDGLGVLDTYLSEFKPISRVEAARLTLEAERNLAGSERPEPLAESLIRVLRSQLSEEVAWLENDAEDDQPTMVHPIERVELSYILSGGQRRQMNNNYSLIQAEEATPLLPNNDDLPTSSGSNEAARWSGWAGFGGFLTAYGEGALAGPLTQTPANTNRARLVRGEVVASFGNVAVSAGEQEMAWGTGYFGSLSQGANARPFEAMRVQNIHPTLLSGFLRYLGPFRGQFFLGRLDHGRTFANPWIAGQIVSFKPLPTFELGMTHTIMFGGLSNDNYGFAGFIGRMTGFSTGSPASANTNSRGGIYFKFRFPSLRDMVVYQEVLGEDNLTKEVPGVGRFLPFLARSYQGGVYLPRLTADGLTTARFEYAILEPNYSDHSDSLYWTYDNRTMGYPLGPNASEVHLGPGRWIGYRYKIDLDTFYTERAPARLAALHKERSGGMAIDILRLAERLQKLDGGLGELRGRAAVEYVHSINYARDNNSLRFTFMLSAGFTPAFESVVWH
jgi:hypothetical protein